MYCNMIYTLLKIVTSYSLKKYKIKTKTKKKLLLQQRKRLNLSLCNF